MTIYVSHSRSFDYQKELYVPLQQSDLATQHQFIFPHDQSEKPYLTKELFQQKKCDLVIAEVTYPATGQGIELGWADIFGIPIACFSREEIPFSQSLNSVTETFATYATTESLIAAINEIVKEREG